MSKRPFELLNSAEGQVIASTNSDGISGRWDASALPGLNLRDPLVVAATLLAQAGTRRDDAGVLVLRP